MLPAAKSGTGKAIIALARKVLSIIYCVLVQPEMERRRFPLVSVPPSGGGFQGIDVFLSKLEQADV